VSPVYGERVGGEGICRYILDTSLCRGHTKIQWPRRFWARFVRTFSHPVLVFDVFNPASLFFCLCLCVLCHRSGRGEEQCSTHVICSCYVSKEPSFTYYLPHCWMCKQAYTTPDGAMSTKTIFRWSRLHRRLHYDPRLQLKVVKIISSAS